MGSDPDSYVIWHSTQVGGFNWTSYSDPDVDEWLEMGTKFVTPEERRPYYEQIAVRLVEGLPYIWLLYRDTTLASRPGLTLLEPAHPQGWYFNVWMWEFNPS